ncbi:MAG: bifunctional folylpolyglutamate synthase/dihydrofolate synthase [Chloroflexota bacterium]
MSEAYGEALRYLFSFANYETLAGGFGPLRAAKLERMERLLELLDHPERAAPILLVAGTKGKGSTAAMIAAILRAGGRRTGLYSQPHLHTFRERIRLDGQLISEGDLAATMDGLMPAVERLGADPSLGRPTTYEVSTALMFQWFRQRQAEAMVVEVGIGGRLDAVNVVTPLVAAITSISYDHMDVLGSTITEIASEKAGIIKPGIGVASARQWPEATTAIERRATEMQAELWRVGTEVALESEARAVAGQAQRLAISVPGSRFQGLELPLAGAVQLENAAVAVAAVVLAERRGLAGAGSGITAGLREVSWPGRLETVHHDPLVLVDGAHNGDSAERLVEAVRTLYPGRPPTFVVGTSRDKDMPGILRPLTSTGGRIILTQSRHPRSASLDQLSAAAREMGVVPATADSTSQALQVAADSLPADGLICVTGSLFVVAEAREHFGLAEPDAVPF